MLKIEKIDSTEQFAALGRKLAADKARATMGAELQKVHDAELRAQNAANAAAKGKSTNTSATGALWAAYATAVATAQAKQITPVELHCALTDEGVKLDPNAKQAADQTIKQYRSTACRLLTVAGDPETLKQAAEDADVEIPEEAGVAGLGFTSAKAIVKAAITSDEQRRYVMLVGQIKALLTDLVKDKNASKKDGTPALVGLEIGKAIDVAETILGLIPSREVKADAPSAADEAVDAAMDAVDADEGVEIAAAVNE